LQPERPDQHRRRRPVVLLRGELTQVMYGRPPVGKDFFGVSAK
jgi:hypothetical protein